MQEQDLGAGSHISRGNSAPTSTERSSNWKISSGTPEFFRLFARATIALKGEREARLQPPTGSTPAEPPRVARDDPRVPPEPEAGQEVPEDTSSDAGGMHDGGTLTRRQGRPESSPWSVVRLL